MMLVRKSENTFKSFNWIKNFFSLPTDIQAEGIPMILGGGDVLMVS